MRSLTPRNALHLLVLGSWIVACDSPVEPEGSFQAEFGFYDGGDPLVQNPGDGADAETIVDPSPPNGHYTLVLKEGEGGQMVTRAGTVFTVFPGTVGHRVGITLDEEVAPTSVGLKFGPPGLEFTNPACLRIRADLFVDPGHVGESFDLRYFDPELLEWTVISQSIVGGDGMLCYGIEHFSKYAISRSAQTE